MCRSRVYRLLWLAVTSCAVLSAPSALAGETRTWTDRQGRTINNAELVRVVDGTVILKRFNQIVRVAYQQLSDADQDYVRGQLRLKGQEDLLPSAKTKTKGDASGAKPPGGAPSTEPTNPEGGAPVPAPQQPPRPSPTSPSPPTPTKSRPPTASPPTPAGPTATRPPTPSSSTAGRPPFVPPAAQPNPSSSGGGLPRGTSPPTPATEKYEFNCPRCGHRWTGDTPTSYCPMCTAGRSSAAGGRSAAYLAGYRAGQVTGIVVLVTLVLGFLWRILRS
jgi:hypothetical protein